MQTKRNFENYKTKRAAFQAYNYLPNKPYWVEDDGVTAYSTVPFGDWLWLPVKKDGKYTRDLLMEYLGRDYI